MSNKEPLTEDDGFSIDDLLAPSVESLDQIDASLEKLEQYAATEQQRSLEVHFGDNTGGPNIEVSVDHSDAGTRAGARDRSSLRFKLEDDLPVSAFRERSEEDQQRAERIEHRIDELAGGLPDDEAAWLRESWTESRADTKDLAAHAVNHLLDAAPDSFETMSWKHHVLIRDLPDGTTVRGDWFDGNETFKKHWPDALTFFDIEQPDGRSIEYVKSTAAGNSLRITDPSSEVPREVPPAESYSSGDIGNGVSVEVRGDPELVRQMQVDHAARQEAHQLGLDQPTEGKIRQLNNALQTIEYQLATGIEAGEG